MCVCVWWVKQNVALFVVGVCKSGNHISFKLLFLLVLIMKTPPVIHKPNLWLERQCNKVFHNDVHEQNIFYFVCCRLVYLLSRYPIANVL